MTGKSGTSTSALLRRSFRVAPALRRGLWLTLFLAIVGTALQIVVPVMLQQIIDNEILGNGDVEASAVAMKGLAAFVAIAAAAGVRWLSLKRLVASSSAGLAELRIKTFAHLHRLSVIELQSERRGALVARVTSDVETIQHFMEWGGVGMILGFAQVILAMAVMVLYQWQMAVIVAIGVLIYTLLILLFQKILSRAHDRVRERVSDALSATGEAISGLPTVRAYGIESEMMEKVDDTLDKQFNAEVKTAVLASSLFSSAELFAGILTAVVIGFGVVLGGEWGMSAGTLVAFLFLVNLLIDPIQRLVESIDQAQSAGAGLRKILGVIETEVSIPDPPDGVPFPSEVVGLRFDDVFFRYPGGSDILSGVSVAIPAGQRVAVVGETGSGKTTFAKLATRLLVPREGLVSIGDVPIDQIALSSLRAGVAYVPQEGFLFDGTIADNIRYGRPGVADEIVRSAFEDLGLVDWIETLTDGVRTNVGERGGNLSAGERQLVALARAWIANPSLLVLDEATSAVDPALEVRIRSAIEHLTAGRTSVTIAHRLSTAEASDRVLVFDAGAIVEDGHHEELLGSAPVYSAMHADWEGSTSASGPVTPRS
jgi:putative ABC transport system ATP-binding protein